MNFEQEIYLNPFLKFWDRGDGVAEISLFNSIIAFIHGEQQIFPEDYYHYDENLETYVSHEDVDFSPVSCFPGRLTSDNEIFKMFNHINVECLDHLYSLVNSLPSNLFPDKPKGSVFDIFSQQDKFLISKEVNFEIIKNGLDINSNIIDNFNSFSHYLHKYFLNYPDISIDFINHSFLNGNVYFLYQLNSKNFLHLVFTSDDKIILGSITKSSKMKDIVILNSSEKNYLFICQTIIEKLNISVENATFKIHIISDFIQHLPREKNIFINDLLKNHLNNFIFTLSNSSPFILERNISRYNTTEHIFSINREVLNNVLQKISIFGLPVDKFIYLLFNDYLIDYHHKNLTK